jgi:replicative DNA helicase
MTTTRDLPNADAALEELFPEFGTEPVSTGSSYATGPINWDQSGAVIGRAIRYLEKTPIAVDGSNGSAACFRVACVLRKGFMLSTDEALEAIRDWNAACQPPWSEKELRHKLDGAGKAPGPSGYLRQTRPEAWQSVKVPEYFEPFERKRTKRPEQEQARTTLKQAALAHIAMLEAGVPDLVSLGIPEVDKSIGGGVAFGEIVLVAARPSHGKSAFALQVVNYQTSQGIPCAFMSEEMSSMSLGKRCTQFLSSVPQESWGKRPEAVKIQIAQHFQDRAPCHIIEHSRTAEKVADEVCKLAKNEGVKTVVVDYVQLLTNGKGSRYETVTESSVILKQACSESGVLMISLAQMGRQIEGRDSFMPKMSDLKESGQLEQDADVILFLVWPHRLDSSKPANEYFVYPAKNRNREIVYPVVRMDFEPSRQRLVSPDEDVDKGFRL